MKSQFKTVALSAIFSIIGLCCTLSTASAESKTIQINQKFKSVTCMTAFSELANEGGEKVKPLLKPDNGITEYSTCKTTTKNEYFELAIIFNDKLQQFISVLFVDDTDKSINQLSTLD
ncbi:MULTISPECIES: hypothetical protein [unclassified Colwellia]|uniref:hypothetical protein n=1 Tax=unclassified Colwellia TaxID=196834 RepID=UPI0015F5FAFD|nr:MULTISPECIES: hypothetical protein [unclassified Colwellia]MBA6230638.1 hypothetical protein [Colwellia sp. MB02u-7]MBA6234569.1 hypothetical protein [Colwellia sp. MB02u-11]MBA6255433.1 hypothetical protein [Colwellia sp. MB3u-28]MBA6261573.1 hypothetical protein [Colwellia sp. MB3u-41]MBA6301123.1 hypothetical protein [Colwellia sp. MB3u-22]